MANDRSDFNSQNKIFISQNCYALICYMKGEGVGGRDVL